MPGADDDRAGFEEFVFARRQALLRTAYLLTADPDDAEDLVQIVLIRTVPHWRKIADRPEPYVRQILARESISRWRARRWREESRDRLPERPVDAADPDDAMALRTALGQLSPRQRAVVVLRYFEDLTERETADVLGIGLGTVKSHGRDALERLRRLLPDLVEDVEPVAPS